MQRDDEGAKGGCECKGRVRVQTEFFGEPQQL